MQILNNLICSADDDLQVVQDDSKDGQEGERKRKRKEVGEAEGSPVDMGILSEKDRVRTVVMKPADNLKFKNGGFTWILVGSEAWSRDLKR